MKQIPLNNKEALAYFTSLQGESFSGRLQISAEKWNRRAESWKKERLDPRTQKDEDRLYSTVDYLKQRGLLLPEYDIADIGCGPGKFAVEFARTAHSVTGFDISERMIYYGNQHIQKTGLSNVALHTCDFQKLDIDREGLIGKFDLVFAALSPAFQGRTELEKAMRMSRGYCCNISHISHSNDVEERIMREVFDREPPVRWSGQSFYSLFNILFLLGYHPEVTYHRRQCDGICIMDEEEADLFMEHMLPLKEQTCENRNRIIKWFFSHADRNGCIKEKRDTVYGRILWDVRCRTARPEYE